MDLRGFCFSGDRERKAMRLPASSPFSFFGLLGFPELTGYLLKRWGGRGGLRFSPGSFSFGELWNTSRDTRKNDAWHAEWGLSRLIGCDGVFVDIADRIATRQKKKKRPMKISSIFLMAR